MKAEIISSGTELLLGLIVNTNEVYLSSRLYEAGIPVVYRTTVGDETPQLTAAVTNALNRADVVIITGGLGPTKDDMTRQIVSTLTGAKLTFDEQSQKQYDFVTRVRGYTVRDEDRIQFMIPEGAIALPNKYGSALGFVHQYKDKYIVTLPGVPCEMKPMFEEGVLPILVKATSGKGKVFMVRKLHCFGLPESDIHAKITHLMEEGQNPVVGLMPSHMVVSIRISAKGNDRTGCLDLLNDTEQEIRFLLGDVVFGVDEDTMQSVVAGMLIASGKTIALAESCTGGLVSSMLTDISGISASLIESVVTYSNESKVNLLGVDADTLRVKGAVSEEVARQMAEGVRAMSKTDYGLATTGIAGPTGGSKEKPVGLVYMAIATLNETIVKRFVFKGDRLQIKDRAAKYILNMLRLEIKRKR